MRLTLALGLMALLAAVSHAHAQAGRPVKAVKSQYACESLCAELFASIRSDPNNLTMRLEEALIINEDCTVDLVTAAIDAVNAEPTLVQKIVTTATDLSPARTTAIAAAVRNYKPTEVASAIPVGATPAPAGASSENANVETIEVRRAELPEVARPAPAAGEEVRRAQLPLATRSLPIVEIRRAEPPLAAIPAAEPMDVQPAPAEVGLMNVPKATPFKNNRR